MTVLAELVIWHSRPFSPTRRVALGDSTLPTDPPPGFGGILLGAVVAAHIDDLDPDLLPDLHRLVGDVELGHRIVQPRLRHRFQTDRVGLSSSRHRLVGVGEGIEFDFDTKGSPAAAGARCRVRSGHRAELRGGIPWRPASTKPCGGTDLSGRPSSATSPVSAARVRGPRAFADPFAWALDVLGLPGPHPDRLEVLAHFRARLREVHPDHGGSADDAGQRILDLTEARRILLG